MFSFFEQTGVWGFPLLVITVANIVLVIRSVAQIPKATLETAPKISTGINAILFWGALAAVLGFLGQFTGIYNALGAIIRATEIDPRLVMMGLRESFTSTLWGLNLLVLSAVAWAILQAWYRRAAAGWERPRPAA